MVSNGDCTVFNKVYDPKTRMDHWVATHLKGIFWEDCKAANVIKSGMKEADSVRVFILFSVDAGGKSYLKPKAFQKKPETHFTFAPEDKLVKGLIEYDGPILELFDLYDDVVTITSVDTMDYGSSQMQHWEVGGK